MGKAGVGQGRGGRGRPRERSATSRMRDRAESGLADWRWGFGESGSSVRMPPAVVLQHFEFFQRFNSSRMAHIVVSAVHSAMEGMVNGDG